MVIHHIKIERFRGIKELDWRVSGDFICLIGPGDSTKSTIIDAIDLTLSSRWNIQFDDSDFYNADTDKPIIITITVGQVPEELLSDDKYGLEIRGWSEANELHDEPREGDEVVLTIRLRIDSSLEPVWTVVNDRKIEGKVFYARDRELLGLARLGGFADRHFSWSRGSILSRLTGKLKDLSSMLTDIGRQARKSLSDDKFVSLKTSAVRAQDLGKKLGVTSSGEYRAHLDVQSISAEIGDISLYDGTVPLRRAGLGTRRLLALALQLEAAREGGIALVDEIEYGLEPHRIRRVLQSLQEIIRKKVSGEAKQPRHGQVIVTTHSPITIVELGVSCLRLVRVKDGITKVLGIGDELQAQARKFPEALLGRRVIVCEGKTEVGVCRSLDAFWSNKSLSPFACLGVVPVCGEGDSASAAAIKFSELGYAVLYFGDSDVDLGDKVQKMKESGIEIVRWDGTVSIEQRCSCDLPWPGVIKMVHLAIDEKGTDAVHLLVAKCLAVKPTEVPSNPDVWAEDGRMREAIGLAAKEGGWFKRPDLGEKLGDIIVEHLSNIESSDLAKKIVVMRCWVDKDGSS